MTVQRVDLNLVGFKTIQENFKKIAIVVAIISGLAFIYDGFSVGTLFLALICSTVCFSPYLLYLKYSFSTCLGMVKKNGDKILHALIKDYGLVNSYSSPGGICIDDINKKIAFFSPNKTEAFICDYSDLRKWYVSTNRSSNTTIDHGFNSSTVNTRATTNFTHIVVQLANTDYPEYRFLVPTVKDDRCADTWIARISAVVNE